MPRRNENARSRGLAGNGTWSDAELRAMSNYVEKKMARHGDAETRRLAILKTTGESIVREHRNSVADLIQTPSIQRVYKAPWYRAINLNTVFEWTCWIAVCIAIGVVLAVIFYGPFIGRMFK
jgi:hypothetical protein